LDPPIILDTSAAMALGHRPVADYAATVTDELGWLIDQVARYPTWTPPGIGPETTATWFDHDAEDAWPRGR
jgi:hypothetical protein